MLKSKWKFVLPVFILCCLIGAAAAPATVAKDRDYDALVNHLKSKYRAKKVKIPFLGLARFAVRIARPAGVKAFNIAVFENLQFERESLDAEMQLAMRGALSPDWSPLLRVRSRDGEQVYLYMREAGKNVRIMMLTIDRQEATIIRAKFNQDKLIKFIENPKIFGVSLNDDDAERKIEKKNSDDVSLQKSPENNKD